MPTDIYLIGLGVGPGVSETSHAQKCFSPNPSGNDSNQKYKAHMPTDIYLIGLGVGPDFSETTQAQKCFSPNPSGNHSYQKLEGPYVNRHLSYWVGCWARLF
jgi:hypothetical protein